MFKFITKQSFLVNLIVAAILIFAVISVFFLSLGWLTHHGSYLQVPSVVNMPVDKAVDLLEKEGFDVVITDSAYNDSAPLNIVKRQLPIASATVKVNRTVFLNINPVELPMVTMPKLEGLSFRFAVESLKKSNLKLGDTTQKPNFMEGSVLDQLYNGKPIAAGDKVRWGSAISLVVGGGVPQVSIPVPELLGHTVEEAKIILEANGIVMASVIAAGDISDTANAFIYKQNPETKDFQGNPVFIQPGQTMDIWIQKERPIIDTSLLPAPPQANAHPQNEPPARPEKKPY